MAKGRHLLVAGALIAVLAGCGTTDDAPAAAPTTSAAATAESEIDLGIPPKPDEKTTTAYLAALRKIDPAIVEEKDGKTLVSRGRDQCSSIKEWPDDTAKLAKLANTRFTSPQHPDGYGTAKAEKINEVVHKYICPTY